MTARTLVYLFAAVGIGMIFFACCNQADARGKLWRARSAQAPYSFTVEDENGNSLSTFVEGGRSYLLGEPGLRYNIRVRNPTNQRMEAVVSVDGRDAVSGRPGDYVRQRGYVIPAYGSLLVEGFRRSMEEVAAFRFTSPDNSYSSRLGTPQNVGVIGVAFFPERARAAPVIRRYRPQPERSPPPYDSSRESRDSEGQPAAAKPQVQPSGEDLGDRPAPSRAEQAAPKGGARADYGDRVDNLGTQYAESHESPASSVSFERASPTHPALVSTLRYDDAEGLQARGIDVFGERYGRVEPDEPQAFPVSHFALPPP